MLGRALAVAALVASAITGTAHADTPKGRPDSASFGGPFRFFDCGSTVCGTADTTAANGYCTSGTAVANLAVTLSGCSAYMDFAYAKNSGLCVGAAFADLLFTDFAGNTLPIRVSLLASDGTIQFQGRFADVGGSGAYSVAGTMVPACGQTGTWSGTLTYVD